MAKVYRLGERIRQVALTAVLAARKKVLLVSTVVAQAFRRGKSYTDGIAVMVDDKGVISLRGVKAEDVKLDNGETINAGLWGPTYTLTTETAQDLVESLQMAIEAAEDKDIFWRGIKKQEGADKDTPPAQEAQITVEQAAAALGLTVEQINALRSMLGVGQAPAAQAPAAAKAKASVSDDELAKYYAGGPWYVINGQKFRGKQAAREYLASRA